MAILFLYSGESLLSSGLIAILGPGDVGCATFRAGDTAFGYGVELVFLCPVSAPFDVAVFAISSLMLSRKAFEGKLITFSRNASE
jgi:hypothetical protein